MKTKNILVLIVIIAFIIIAGIFVYLNGFVPSTSQNTTIGTNATSTSLLTYDNNGVSFQYPSEWGLAEESFDESSWSMDFVESSSTGQSILDVYVERDTDVSGTTILNETLDQMIARFRVNNKYIFDVKEIVADGVSGRELFYNSAVTGEPYHVEAFFPFGSGTYINFGADYDMVSQNVFDTVISTLKWHDDEKFLQEDPSTYMMKYENNGISFKYPARLDTNYAWLTVKVRVEKIDSTKLDKNGCYPVLNEMSGIPNTSNTTNINSTKFCTTIDSGVGAGQLYNDYNYTTSINGKTYTIDYSVHTSNGCGAYMQSENLIAPENKNYNECMDFQNNYENIVMKPIQASIATFEFVK